MQQFETSTNHTILTSLPPEIHHCVLSYMDNWREKIHYCTHVSKLIFSPMVHDEHSSLGMFGVLCYDLKELELENLFELCFDETVRLYSNCNFRKLVLEWIQFSTKLFPELVEKKKEKIVDYWNKSIDIYKNSFHEKWPYEWTLKEKNILKILNRKRCVAKKERNWKETLRGIIYEKKIFELNIIIDGLPKKGAFGKKSMCYFSKLVDLLKSINLERRKQIITQLYSGNRYCFLGSVLSSFQKYSPKKEDIEIIVPFISYYLEERYQYSLNYEFMTSSQNFVALLTMIKMGCIDSVTDLLTNKISNFEPTNARKLLVAFMKALVPIEKIKQCLIDTRIITSSVILSRDSMDKTIPLQICIINAKKLYLDWEYFRDLIDLVSEIIQQDCNNENIGMSYKTIMLQIFGRKVPTY